MKISEIDPRPIAAKVTGFCAEPEVCAPAGKQQRCQRGRRKTCELATVMLPVGFEAPPISNRWIGFFGVMVCIYGSCIELSAVPCRKLFRQLLLASYREVSLRCGDIHSGLASADADVEGAFGHDSISLFIHFTQVARIEREVDVLGFARA